MPRMTKHIAATAGLVAALGGFGVGAYALAQNGTSFDPSAFMAAYDNGADDKTKGYQANPTDSDAEANRKDDGDKDQGSSVDDAAENQTPTASELPVQGASGTTAVRMTGDGSGTATAAGASGNGSSSGSGTGNTISGPVIPGSGDANGNGGASGGGNGDNNGGNGGNNGGNAGSDWGTQNSYKVLPQDPTADRKDPSDWFYDGPVDGTNDAIKDLTINDVRVNIGARSAEDTPVDGDLYVGQKLDAWTVFLAMRAQYAVISDSGVQTYEWVCEKKDFDSYPYFKITGFPEVVPNNTFTIKYAYRINDNDTWHEGSLEYPPAQTATFIVSNQTNEDGSRKYIFKSYDSPVKVNERLANLLNALGYYDYASGELTHYVVGWLEGDREVPALYTPTPGRHVIEPSKVVKVPKGVTMDLVADYIGGEWGTYTYQAITAVEDDASILKTDAAGKRTLVVPEGVDMVSIGKRTEVDYLDLPSTMRLCNASGEGLRVKRAYRVDADNELYATTSDGVLTNKEGTEYYGIPTSKRKLVVPANVTKVDIPEGTSLRTIVLEAGEGDALPEVNGISNMSGCNVVVEDAAAQSFIAAHLKDFSSGSGNTIALASNPKVHMTIDDGVVSTGSTVVSIADTGSSWATVGDLSSKGGATFGVRCLSDNPTVNTLVLSGAGSYTFEDGCLEGSSVVTIVCNTEEQCDYVEGRLDAAGAPDAAVVMMQHTKEGFYYYAEPASDMFRTSEVNGDEIYTLFKAPSNIQNFDGSFEADDGSTVTPSMIASYAFKGCDRLEWLQTAEETWYIGAEAFKGCEAIQGALLGCQETLNVETEAFAGCSSMRFLASRSVDGEFADATVPNVSCLMYAPTGAAGYFDSFTEFTEASGVADYKVVEQDDGSLVLCGVGADGSAWLVLATGNTLSGEVKLPAETIEIFSNAFAQVKGDFTINWRDLTVLQYVDQNAFKGSGVSGDLYLGDSYITCIWLADSAFADCANIKSVEGSTFYLNMGDGTFQGCTSLKSVKFAAGDDWGQYSCYMPASAFYGCSSLTSIELTSWNPMSLSLFSFGSAYAFDGSVSPEADAERIRVKVPGGAEETYLKKWCYYFAGYSDYDTLHDGVRDDLMRSTLKTPTEAQIKKEMANRLLVSENLLRKMLGMPQVTECTVFSYVESDGCIFETRDGVTTLTSVSTDTTELDISAAAPADAKGIVIPAGVFSECSGLKRIVLGTKVSEIQSGAFEGCDGVTVVLPAASDEFDDVLVELTGGDEMAPFAFGGNIKLEVPKGSEEKYLAAWPRQMIGVDDFTMNAYVGNVYWTLASVHEPDEITVDMLNFSVNESFLENENLLRNMMGLDQVENYQDACSFYDASWYLSDWGDFDDSDGDLDEIPDPGEGDDPSSGNGSGADSANADELKPDDNLNADGEQTPVEAPTA